MKTVLRTLVRRVLKGLARKRLKKFSGKIVAVTGSVGKSSTKEAIFTVLNTRYRVRRSRGNMNSDFGLLLTILDIDSGYSSAVKWSWLLLKGFFHAFFKDHSEILLLELGVDKPKDMDFLVAVVKPDVVVFTSVEPAHMDEGQFESLEKIFEEKAKLTKALKEGGKLIVNIDNDFTASLAKRGVLTYGKADCDFRISAFGQSLEGSEFKINGKEVKIPALGEFLSYAAAAACCCGELFGIELRDCAAALEKYKLPPGRMNIIEGVSETTIIDSSYNASPASMIEALKTLNEVCGGQGEKTTRPRRVAVLGNMNDLGILADELHRKVAAVVPKYTDLLITVGKNAAIFGEKMEAHKFFEFSNAHDAAAFFEKKIEKGDVILVKGSQNNVRLERFVKAFMANPREAKEKLVRQNKVWLKNLM